MRTWLTLLLVAITAQVHAETLTLQAGDYADFRQLMAGESASAVTLTATLTFPDDAQVRHPAVVLVHTLGGYMERNEGWHAARFREAGFATLAYDSIAARRMREGAGGSAWPAAISEAYAALRAIAGHPRIDGGRVGIVGFSFGGEVAHLSAFLPLRAALASGQTGFAAHLSYYPAGVFAITAGPDAYTGAPILMLLGGKDDNLPLTKIKGYLAYAKDAGFAPPIDTIVYPDAYHAWTVPGLGEPRFYPQYPSTRQCPYLLLKSGPPLLLVDGRAKPIDNEAMRTCLNNGRGYSMASDDAARTQSTRDAIAFLRKTLKP